MKTYVYLGMAVCALFACRASKGAAIQPGTRPADLGLLGVKAPDMPPAWIKPGLRIVYLSGQSSVPGSSMKLYEDPNGPLVGSVEGKRYTSVEMHGSASVGFWMTDIIGVDGRNVAFNQDNFLVLNLAKFSGVSRLSSNGDAVTMDKLPVVCADAKILQGLPDSSQPLRTVFHCDYSTGGKTYHAIAIVFHAGGNLTATVYDLETGLMLHRGSIFHSFSGSSNPDLIAPADTTETTLDLAEVRQVSTPWSDSAIPDSLPGKTLDYQGKQTYKMMNVGVVSTVDTKLKLGKITGDYILVDREIDLRSQFGKLLQSKGHAVISSQSLFPPYIDPAVLKTLKADQVIDDDRVIHCKTVVKSVGQSNQGDDIATIVSEFGDPASDRNIYIYDRTDGMMTDQFTDSPSKLTQTELHINDHGN